jgi:hypothetical protein
MLHSGLECSIPGHECQRRRPPNCPVFNQKAKEACIPEYPEKDITMQSKQNKRHADIP